MDDSRVESLVNECKQIQEDSTYSAEVHYIIAGKLAKKAFWYKLIPACITVFSAYKLLTGSQSWVAWITLLSGLVTIMNVFMEPEKRARGHQFAAKSFTVLKHEARSLHESFKDFISDDEFYHTVKRLREKYNMLAQLTPPTDDKDAWEEARKRIKAGVHKADFRSEDK